MDILKKSWIYFRPYKIPLILSFLMGLAVVALSMVNPYIVKLIFDRVIYGGESKLLPQLLLLMAVQTVVRHGIQYTRSYMVEFYSQKVMVRMRDDVFKKFFSMTFNFFNKEKTGQLMTVLSGDVDAVRNMVMSTIPAILELLISFVFATVVLFFMNFWLTVICLLILPFVYVTTKKFSRLMKEQHTEIREQASQLSTVVQENINGVRVVRAFARENFENIKFNKENEKFRGAHLTMIKVWSRYYWKLALSGNYPYLAVMLIGGILTAQGKMSIGTYVAFGGYIGFLMNPINAITNYVSSLQNAMASGEKLFAFMIREPEIKNSDDRNMLESFVGNIEFHNVSLKYGSNSVLNDITLDIPRGRKVGIMGETGSGKTSLVNLIGRFYDCSSGEILIDGVNIKNVDINALRKNISYVMQDVFLFSDSVESNIVYGNSSASFENAVKAANVAQAHNFIAKMPEGYDTVVGERGIGLSGGQKQRISIARAILTDAPIVILDDSTSSLDMEIEHEILSNFSEALEGKTQIIIAHRISSVRDADEIIMLKDGKIAERGTHETLVAMNGLYADIYREQYGEHDSNVESEVAS